MKLPRIAFLSCLLLACGLLDAEDKPDPGILTLDRIFIEKEFQSKSFSGKWLEGGSGYTYVKPLEEGGGEEIWMRRPGRKSPTLLVAASRLTPQDETEPLSIDGYTFSEDRLLVLIYTNSKRVWRRNSRGDYWLLDRTTGELRKLGGKAQPSTLMFAKISPTGSHVAYVRNRNLYVEDLSSHTIRQLTETPNKHIINGTADWVYEEELRLRDGFRWSPDGRSIAYWQFDESGVRRHTLVDHVSGLYPKLKSFAVPKTGQQNSAVRIGVVGIDGAETRWLEIPGDPRNHYLARMEWAENSEELVVQQLDRTQETNRIFLGRAADGSVKTILTEKDAAWVDVHDEMFWVHGGTHFTWISERDDWRHVYLVSRDGKEITCLTPGDFDVIELLHADDKDEWIYFIASPRNPAERYLYRAKFDGSGRERLTSAKEKRGTHSYKMSPDGRFAFLTSSNFDTPPVTRLISLPDHETIEVLESNEELRKKFSAVSREPSEFFDIDIGTDLPLPARCVKPPGFDPAKTYPLLIYVYGEPAGQVVKDRWSGSAHLWHLMLAQQGYVIMSFDNRGTAGPLGRDWRKAAHRKIGILAPKDQAAAVQAVLEQRPYLDPDRVGIWGWSGGGSMSLNAIFKYPDLYRTAIAVASVPNQRHYDTIYQERYMGLPGENVEGYRKGSPINFAHQLKGNLLIVHGAADDNCHYQTFEKLVDALVRHNKPFSMMTYPKGSHSISEGKNTTLHLYSLMTRFLHQHLPVDSDASESPR